MNVTGALVFLVDNLISLYAYLVFARFIMQVVRVNFRNPVSAFIVKATNPPLMPLRKIIPGYGGFDFAAIVLVILLQVAKVSLVVMISHGIAPIATIMLLSLRETTLMVIYFFMFCIFVSVIMSWVNPDPYHPVAALFRELSEPILEPFRRLIPPMGGMDISPLIALLMLQALVILLSF